MKVLDDYRCTECGLEDEHLVRIGDTVSCPSCGAQCDRMTSAMNFTLDSASGDFPSATMKWEREHVRQVRTAERKQANDQ
jgi:putative FmdB family regulatory protein